MNIAITAPAANTSIRNTIEQVARASAVALAFCVPLTNTGTTICSIIFAILALATMDRNKYNMVIKNPITIAIGIFLAVYIVGMFYSDGAIWQSLRKMSRVIYIPLLIPLFANKTWRRSALVAYLLAMFISVLASWELRMPFFKDSIFTSLFMAFAIFVNLHFVVEYKRARLITIPLLFVFIYYLFFICTGRTGQIVFFILYSLFCWQTFGINVKKQALAAVVLGLIFCSALFAPSTFKQRQTEAAEEMRVFMADKDAPISTSSMGGRFTFVQNALSLIVEKPIFGWGSGAFPKAYAENISAVDAKNIFTDNPHNQYVLTWVETGILGVSTLIFMLFTMAKTFWREPQLEGKLGVGLVIAIAAGCAVNSWLLDYASMFFLVTYSGILAGIFAKNTYKCI